MKPEKEIEEEILKEAHKIASKKLKDFEVNLDYAKILISLAFQQSRQKALKDVLEVLDEWYNDERTCSTCFDELKSKIKKELGEKKK